LIFVDGTYGNKIGVSTFAWSNWRLDIMPSSMRAWLRLPSRIALLLGMGALSVAGAKAATVGEVHPANDGARVPQQSGRALADLMIWQESGRIYVSEAGKPAEELRLGNTAEARLLGELLEQQGATAATPRALNDRIILVGGGGEGIHWDSSAATSTSRPSGTTADNQGTNATSQTQPNKNGISAQTGKTTGQTKLNGKPPSP
jgi:hypothetical protein